MCRYSKGGVSWSEIRRMTWRQLRRCLLSINRLIDLENEAAKRPSEG